MRFIKREGWSTADSQAVALTAPWAAIQIKVKPLKWYYAQAGPLHGYCGGDDKGILRTKDMTKS
jgi:hypothetical protein